MSTDQTGHGPSHEPDGDHLPAHRAESTAVADPLPDPGLPAHEWRPTDVDERAEKRAERQVALMFGLSGAVHRPVRRLLLRCSRSAR